MAGLMATFFQPLKFFRHSLQVISTTLPNTNLVKPDCFSLSSIRNKVRVYFPRPNEVKRVRRHGWDTRISTPNGRRVIMRRLLKGRHVLTH